MPTTVVHFRAGVDLPDHAYLDTNFLFHSLDQASPKYRSASLCFRELVQRQIELSVSALVFDELWWGLFRVSHRLLTGRELTGREYKDDPEIWRWAWPRVREITEEILNWPRLRILESASSRELVRGARDLMNVNPLAPRDAFHLAAVLSHGIPALVTADSDFDSVQLPGGQQLTIVKF